jgi:hypothetical protein
VKLRRTDKGRHRRIEFTDGLEALSLEDYSHPKASHRRQRRDFSLGQGARASRPEKPRSAPVRVLDLDEVARRADTTRRNIERLNAAAGAPPPGKEVVQ